jgi:tetratricopeptide (TPR) repeat protein
MAQSAEHTEAKAMARQYALILAEDPADAAAHLGYIRALEALQRWPDAAAAIGLARRLLPDLSDGLRPQHVNALYRAQRLSEAVLVQQEIAAACPGDLPAQLRLGRLLLQARSFGAAAEVYGRVQAAAPAGSEPQAQALLGRLNALSRAGDWHKILAETAAVLDAAVSEGPPERLQVLRYRARALRELGQVEAAAQVLTQTLAQPSSGAGGTEGCAAGLKAGPTPAQDALELRLHLALLYAAKGDLPGAAATFDAVLAQDPSHGAARLGRADVALRQDDPAQAMAILEAALLPGSDRTPPRPPRRMIDRQRVINRYVSLALQAGDVARLEAALPALGPYLDRLSEPGLAGLLRVIEQAAPPELTRALLSRLLAQDRLSLQSATYLVELALRSAGSTR